MKWKPHVLAALQVRLFAFAIDHFRYCEMLLVASPGHVSSTAACTPDLYLLLLTCLQLLLVIVRRCVYVSCRRPVCLTSRGHWISPARPLYSCEPTRPVTASHTSRLMTPHGIAAVTWIMQWLASDQLLLVMGSLRRCQQLRQSHQENSSSSAELAVHASNARSVTVTAFRFILRYCRGELMLSAHGRLLELPLLLITFASIVLSSNNFRLAGFLCFVFL